ncbi:unnamed protein product [Mytilus coruscus]|uniref:Integrase catalytic domain-containing protein n=1 Tax=Mytilus coruscus TaxID=42192 RepID=A0A6J8C6Y8_MYTCO|nr:unnamed protein product [Mytilus coruscus]
MPLVSNELKAPLVADLDVSALNAQLKDYIDDNIVSTFTEKMEDIVNKKLLELKDSMLHEYSSKLEKSNTRYDRKLSEMHSEYDNRFSDLSENQSENVTKFMENVQELQNTLMQSMNEQIGYFQKSKTVYENQVSEILRNYRDQTAKISKGAITNFTDLKTDMEEWKNDKVADLIKAVTMNLTQFETNMMYGNFKITCLLFLINLVFTTRTVHRSCSPKSEAAYDAIFRTIEGTFDIPVKERTLEQNNAISTYYKRKDLYTIQGQPPRLYFDNKPVLKKDECPRLIKKQYTQEKGIGPRRMFHQLKNRFSGLSEKLICKEMNKELYYKSLTARFKNKAPYRPVVSQGVHHILQIDLVDMQRHKVTHRKKIFKYVLSVLDVFSRYVWLRPLQNKNSATVKRELKSLFEEFGEPKVIQHDCGKEFEGEVRIFLKRKNQADKEPSIPPAESGKSGKNAFNFEKKIAFDLLKMKQVGVNLVRQLQKYERKINDGPKECLAWKCPFEIYYGRTRQSHLRKSFKSPTSLGGSCKNITEI